MAAQPAAARRHDEPGGSPSWGAASPRIAAATTTRRRARFAASSARGCAPRTGRCSCSPRASSTTATTAPRASASRKLGARRAGGRRRWRRSAPPTACGWKATARRPPPRTRGWSRRRRRARATPRWRGFASPSRPAIAKGGGAQAVPGDRARFPGAPAGRRSDPPDRRAARPSPADAAATPDAPKPPPAQDLSPADRLRRAESLSKDRHWDEALAELAKLPAALPPELAAERDYQIGMTKFRMRRDYPTAGQLLLGAVDKLSGEKAASAQFHGARALSRVDRDDEAIAGYRKVITQFPNSRWAAEAQYLSGWLDYNRGRFKESLPAFQATLDQLRQERVRRRRRLVPGVRALPARQRRRGDRRLRALRAPARARRRVVRRDRRARRLLARAARRQARQEGRRRGRLPRPGAPRAALVLRPAGARAPGRGRASRAARRCRPRRSRWRRPRNPLRDPVVARATS